MLFKYLTFRRTILTFTLRALATCKTQQDQLKQPV